MTRTETAPTLFTPARGVDTSKPLRASYGLFTGGTRLIDSARIWERFGDASNYVEPFAGGLGVLTARPHDHDWWNRIESINDPEGFVSNFWRAWIKAPEEVAVAAVEPIPLRDDWTDFRQSMMANPWVFDTHVAGLWLVAVQEHAGAPVTGDEDACEAAYAIANRTRNVRVACGAWSRLLNQVAEPRAGQRSAVYLDPPPLGVNGWVLYADQKRKERDFNPIQLQAFNWAIANGADPRYRIVLSMAITEHESRLLDADGWTPISSESESPDAWQCDDEFEVHTKRREMVWCSPTTRDIA